MRFRLALDPAAESAPHRAEDEHCEAEPDERETHELGRGEVFTEEEKSDEELQGGADELQEADP